MTAYSTPGARDLGAELKAARLRAGLTQKQVGERIERQQHRVSKWEQGIGLPTEADLGKLLLVYEIAGEEQEDFRRLLQEAAAPDRVSPGVGRRLASLIESERRARRIVNVEPLFIPGLCQTRDYAHAIMAGGGLTREQANQRVDVRMDRQALLADDNAPEFVAIIGVHALIHPPCDRPTMIEQLEKLLAMAELPTVSILVLPLDIGYSPALYGPFALIEPRKGEPVVRQEHLAATTTLTNTRDVRTYRTAVDDIHRQAMSADLSVAFIRKLLKEWSMEDGD